MRRSAIATDHSATNRRPSRLRVLRTGGENRISITPDQTAHGFELHDADPRLRRCRHPGRSDLYFSRENITLTGSEDTAAAPIPSRAPSSFCFPLRLGGHYSCRLQLTSQATAAPINCCPAIPLPPFPFPHKQLPNHRPKSSFDIQPPTESGRNLGTLLVVAVRTTQEFFSTDNFNDNSLQAGQLRLPISNSRTTLYKSLRAGFRILPSKRSTFARANRHARLQPPTQPHLAALASLPSRAALPEPRFSSIKLSSAPFSPMARSPSPPSIPETIPSNCAKSDSSLGRSRNTSLPAEPYLSAAADAALEAAPGELKITFTPADAKVAIVKGDLLKMVSSGVPLNLAPGTYTLTARTAERFTRSSTLEVIAGQSKTLDLSLAPSGMSKWDDPGAWKHEKDSFIHKGGDFVLYGVAPASGTFVFSAMLAKGHLLQWVLNYTRPQKLRPLPDGRQ